MDIRVKRIYLPWSKSDGYRLLVDRLWPRGVSKERAALDGWIKDIAPSPELRTWFAHKEENFGAFKAAYIRELDADPEKIQAVQAVLEIANKQPVTLLYAAKSSAINHAVVLREYLLTKTAAPPA